VLDLKIGFLHAYPNGELKFEEVANCSDEVTTLMPRSTLSDGKSIINSLSVSNLRSHFDTRTTPASSKFSCSS
jgi:hypothetical protein